MAATPRGAPLAATWLLTAAGRQAAAGSAEKC